LSNCVLLGWLTIGMLQMFVSYSLKYFNQHVDYDLLLMYSFLVCYTCALLICYLLLPVEPTSTAHSKGEIQPSTPTKYSSWKENRNSAIVCSCWLTLSHK
jgi:hypothetical protein